MNEKKYRLRIQDKLDDKVVSLKVKYETMIEAEGCWLGIADILLPDLDVAIEVKTSNTPSLYRKGVGQTMAYSIAGYDAFLFVPHRGATRSTRKICERADIGLLTMDFDGNIRCYKNYRDWMESIDFEDCTRESLPLDETERQFKEGLHFLGGLSKGRPKHVREKYHEAIKEKKGIEYLLEGEVEIGELRNIRDKILFNDG